MPSSNSIPAPAASRQARAGATEIAQRLSSRAAVALIAAAAGFYLLQAGRDILLPVALAGFLAMVLYPVVDLLRRAYVPTPVGAALVLMVITGGVAYGFYTLVEPALLWMDRMPQAIDQVESKLWPVKSTIAQASDASKQLEEATDINAGETTKVRIEDGTLASDAMEVVGATLQDGLITVALLLFMLSTGRAAVARAVAAIDSRLVRGYAEDVVAGLRVKVTHYLAVMTAVNAVLGTVTGLCMWMLGMPNPALWGAVAACLNFIPYAGPAATATVLGVVSLLTFDDLLSIATPVLVYVSLTFLEGNIITPAIMGRRLMLNPVAVLISVVFWFWIWGIAGALLAVPFLAAIQVLCEPVPEFRSFSELIGAPGRTNGDAVDPAPGLDRKPAE